MKECTPESGGCHSVCTLCLVPREKTVRFKHPGCSARRWRRRCAVPVLLLRLLQVSLPRVQCQEVEEKVCCTCTPNETVAGVPAQGAVPGDGGECVLYLYSY
jgi:hypothetical protein